MKTFPCGGNFIIKLVDFNIKTFPCGRPFIIKTINILLSKLSLAVDLLFKPWQYFIGNILFPEKTSVFPAPLGLVPEALPFGTECGGKYCQYIGKLMIRWSGDIENYCNILPPQGNISTALCAKGQGLRDKPERGPEKL
jgi:hypothetical protein